MLAILQETKTIFMNALFIVYAFFITTVSANEVVFKGHSQVYCDGNMPNISLSDLPNIQTTSYGCTPLSISYELTISTLLSEPVFRCTVTWDFYGFKTNFHYSDSLLKAYPDIYPQTYPLKENESRIKPYDLEFWINVNANGGMHSPDVLVKCDPGILGKQGKTSFNTAWSTNWDKTFLTHDASKYLSHAEAKKFAKQLFKDAKDNNKDPYSRYNYFIQHLVSLSKLKFNSSEIDQLAIKQYLKLKKRERKATSTNKVDDTNNSSDDFWSSSSESSSQTNAVDDDFWSSSESASSRKVDQGGDFWSGGDDGSLYAYKSKTFYEKWVADKKKELNSHIMPPAELPYKSNIDELGLFTSGVNSCLNVELMSNTKTQNQGAGIKAIGYTVERTWQSNCPVGEHCLTLSGPVYDIEYRDTNVYLFDLYEFKVRFKNMCQDSIIVGSLPVKYYKYDNEIFNKFNNVTMLPNADIADKLYSNTPNLNLNLLGLDTVIHEKNFSHLRSISSNQLKKIESYSDYQANLYLELKLDIVEPESLELDNK